MKSFFLRIIHDKLKLFFVLVIVVLPVIQVVQVWIVCHNLGLGFYSPPYATFVALPGVAHHILNRVFTWFMPLYMALIFADTVIEDSQTRLSSSEIVRIGKKSYIRTKVIGTFTMAFVLIFFSLLLNLMLCYIVFSGGKFIGMDPGDSPENFLYNISHAHPLLANIAFDLVKAFMCALIATVGASLALIAPNRKIVYSLTLIIWFIPIMLNKSLVLIFKPFSEYDFQYLLPIFFSVTFAFVLIIICMAFWRLKDDEA